jgi:hypothetical protein
MKKLFASMFVALGLSVTSLSVVAEETAASGEASTIDQYTEMLSNYMNSLSSGAGQGYGSAGSMSGFNPMAMMNPMSMMNPMAMMNPMSMMGGMGGMGWGGQSGLGAQMMMNPANWMNPQTYAYLMSPEAMAARINPANWLAMMNPATYAPLMNPMAYMTFMGQAMNPNTYIEMTKLLLTPEMYTKWYDATLETAKDLAKVAE